MERYFTQGEVLDLLGVQYGVLKRRCDALDIQWEKHGGDQRYKKITEAQLLELASSLGLHDFSIPDVVEQRDPQETIASLAQQLEIITVRFDNITQSWERERLQLGTELAALREQNHQLASDLEEAKRENTRLKRRLASSDKPEHPQKETTHVQIETVRTEKTFPQVPSSDAQLLSPIVITSRKEHSPLPSSALVERKSVPASNGDEPSFPPPGSVLVKGFFSSHNASKGIIEGIVHRGEVETWQRRGEYFTIEQHAQAVALLYERDRRERKGKQYEPGEKRKEHLCAQCTYIPDPQQ